MKKLFSEIPYLQSGRVILKEITDEDADALREFVNSERVYRYLPAFLFEKKYEDIHEVIRKLYTECFQDSIILGVYINGVFGGLIELYGYNDRMHKVSVGCRLSERYWYAGIAAEAAELMVRYLYDETDIEIITASTLTVNKAAGNSLRKTGFDLVVSGADEDWGFDQPVKTDKWIRLKTADVGIPYGEKVRS